jgi:hypothetical protein
MPVPEHLLEGDYAKLFPNAADEFPAAINEEHYIDAWLINSAFASIIATEQYLIDNKANIEAEIGDDIIGVDGELEISIPAARYPAYKTALAWDSNLLEENIKNGETIFGVTGSLSGGAATSLFKIDIDGGLVPVSGGADCGLFVIDENDDLVPSAGSAEDANFELDENDDVMPIAA